MAPGAEADQRRTAVELSDPVFTEKGRSMVGEEKKSAKRDGDLKADANQEDEKENPLSQGSGGPSQIEKEPSAKKDERIQSGPSQSLPSRTGKQRRESEMAQRREDQKQRYVLARNCSQSLVLNSCLRRQEAPAGARTAKAVVSPSL